MVVGLFNLLSHLKEEYARAAVNELIMLVMDEPQILKPHLNHLLLDILNVLKCKKMTDETKLFLDKFLLAMAEATDLALMMRDLPHETMLRLLKTSMQRLLSIKDGNAGYNIESEQGENTGKLDVYKYGILYLRKLSTALGEKRILPLWFELFVGHMEAIKWKNRHAGISLLAVIAEECSDEMVRVLDSSLDLRYHIHQIDFVGNLIMLVMDEPQILKPYLKRLNHLVLDMLNVLECKKVRDETKLFVDKFLLAMAEATDLEPMMRDLPHETMLRLLKTSMQLLLSIKDDNAWYNMESEKGENAGKLDVYKYGILYPRKLSTALGEKRILPLCFELFLGHMEAIEWKKRHAGISLLAVIAEECSDEMVMRNDCLEQVTAIILKSFKDPHPRVCWATFSLMQQPTNLVQTMQILYHLRICLCTGRST